MAILWVRQSQESDAEQTLDGGLSITTTYFVRTTAIGDGALTVLAATGVPALGSAYTNGTESSSNLILRTRRPKREKLQPLLWTVECHYTEKEVSGEGGDDADYPPSKPVQYSRRTGYEVVDMLVDAYGIKVQNSVGDPFLDAVPTERPYTILTLEKNVEQAFDFDALESLRNTVNSAPFSSPLGSWAAYEGRIVNVDATGEFDALYGAYAKVTVEIHFRKSSIWVPTIASNRILPDHRTEVLPWDITRRNIGVRYLPNGDDGRPQPATARGFQLNGAVDLNSDGTERTTEGDPYYYVYKPCSSSNWSALASLLSL